MATKVLRLLLRESSRPYYGTVPVERRHSFAFSVTRALLQRQNLEAAGLGCLMPFLEVWKGSTVAGPLPGVPGGRTMEVYLQRWPADKKV